MAKKRFRKCMCTNCLHPESPVDTEDDGSFVCDKHNKCYHKDCYDRMMSLRNDMALINDLWTKNISTAVNYAELRKIVNSYLNRGVEMDYIIFCLQYVIAKRMTLNYPAGFQYYLDKKEIKEAYEKKQTQKKFDEIRQKQKERTGQDQPSIPVGSQNAPSFAIRKQKEEGFGSILK